MIFNTYQAMQQLRQWYDTPLSIDRILEIHRTIAEDTLDDAECVGRFRRDDEAIRVYDNRDGTLLHDPPPAGELDNRLKRLCEFANESATDHFLHPIVRAIAIHFQIGYDHPFVDGNGRVARALFYWSMARSGYWLTEFVSISSVLRKAPAQYARAYLYTEDDESDLGYFVDHQLRVLEQAVDGFCRYMRGKKEEAYKARNLLKSNSKLSMQLNYRQKAILLDAIQNPRRIYRIAEHQSIHQTAYQTARTDLLELVKLKLLRKLTQANRFFFQPAEDLPARLERE